MVGATGSTIWSRSPSGWSVQALRAPVGGNCSALMAPIHSTPHPPPTPTPTFSLMPPLPVCHNLFLPIDITHTNFFLLTFLCIASSFLPALMGWDAFIGG